MNTFKKIAVMASLSGAFLTSSCETNNKGNPSDEGCVTLTEGYVTSLDVSVETVLFNAQAASISLEDGSLALSVAVVNKQSKSVLKEAFKTGKKVKVLKCPQEKGTRMHQTKVSF